MDLKKFRKIAAGDRLRGQYQALSQDPNSLSNLDQVYIYGFTQFGVYFLVFAQYAWNYFASQGICYIILKVLIFALYCCFSTFSGVHMRMVQKTEH